MSRREKSGRNKRKICYSTGFPVVVDDDTNAEEEKKEQEKINKDKENNLFVNKKEKESVIMAKNDNNDTINSKRNAKINSKSKGNSYSKHLNTDDKNATSFSVSSHNKSKKSSKGSSLLKSKASPKNSKTPAKHNKTQQTSQNKNHLQPPYPLFNDQNHTNLTSSSFAIEISENDIFREGITSIANLLKNKKNIVVLTGAGISVSCGIPDFRSKNTGLYSTLDAQALGLNFAEELFDLEFFTENPQPFYKFARNLYPGYVTPSASHKFLALLEERKMLLRVYTQNIDGLEEIAGVSSKKIVYAHGSLTWAQCTRCRRKFDAKEISEDVMVGIVPRCKQPVSTTSSSGLLKRKASSGSIASRTSVSSACSTTTNKRARRLLSSRVRSYSGNNLNSNDNDAIGSLDSSSGLVNIERENKREEKPDYQNTTPTSVCGGVIKPGVTFFGEKLGDKVGRCLESDHAKADALIVMGTSLSVAPMSKVIQYLPPSIPRILINRNVVTAPQNTSLDDDLDENSEEEDFRDGYVFDACLLGFCDDVTRHLVKEMLLDNGRTSSLGGSTSPCSAENEGKVLSSLATSDDNTVINRGIHNHPPERVFLFPGAVIDRDDSDSDLTYKEVASCDGCQQQIEGTIMKCIECFDFDLCMKCYPVLRKSHSGGKHKFVSE